MAKSGKIARLPHKIREKINRRLHDGQTGPIILPWLNSIRNVKAILADQFKGEPIKRQNLDSWRRTGYRLWLEQQQPFLQFNKIAEKAGQISRAARGTVAGAAAIASSKAFELLDSGNCSVDDIAKIASFIKPLLTAEQSHARLKLEKARVKHGSNRLLLGWDKHQRDVVAIAQRLLNDERARQIQAADFDNSAKIELLGYHLFGNLWKFRPVPEHKKSPEPQVNQSSPQEISPIPQEPGKDEAASGRIKQG